MAVQDTPMSHSPPRLRAVNAMAHKAQEMAGPDNAWSMHVVMHKTYALLGLPDCRQSIAIGKHAYLAAIDPLSDTVPMPPVTSKPPSTTCRYSALL